MKGLLKSFILLSCLLIFLFWAHKYRILASSWSFSQPDQVVVAEYVRQISNPSITVTSPDVLLGSDLILGTLYHPPLQPHYQWLKNNHTEVELEKFFHSLHDQDKKRRAKNGSGSGAWLKIECLSTKVQKIPFHSIPFIEFLDQAGKSGYVVRSGTETKIIFPTEGLEKGLEPKDYISKLVLGTDQEVESISRFGTTAMLLNLQDFSHTMLVRNQPPRLDLTEKGVHSAILSGADFLIRHQKNSGKFSYSYNPITDGYDHNYNNLRHAGTTFSLYQVYGLCGEQKYYQAAEKALGWMSTHKLKTSEDFSYIIDRNQAKLGGAALALLAYTERERHLRDQRDELIMDRLGRFILRCLHENGEFQSYYKASPTMGMSERSSVYYPGEATLALVRLYNVTSNSQWLVAAEKAAQYLISRGKILGVDVLLFPDAWLMYALAELYEISEREEYLSYCAEMADYIIAAQYQKGEREPAFDGAALDNRFPRSTPAGARAEGLGAFCRALSKSPKSNKLDYYRGALLHSAAFQLTQQAGWRNEFYLKIPARARGGFFGSTLDPRMRIDYTQHNISALLYVHEWLKL